MMSVTQRQNDLLAFIRTYMDGHDGVAPSYDEMMEAIKATSKSNIHHLITKLEERGKLKRLPCRARAISPLPDTPRLVGAITAEKLSEALLTAHGFDDGEGVMIVATQAEIEETLRRALK